MPTYPQNTNDQSTGLNQQALEDTEGSRLTRSILSVHEKAAGMRILYVSSNVQRILDMDPQSMVGRPITEFIADGKADDYQTAVLENHRNATMLTNIKSFRSDGEIVYFRVINFNCDNMSFNVAIFVNEPIALADEIGRLKVQWLDGDLVKNQNTGTGQTTPNIPQAINNLDVSHQLSRNMGREQSRHSLAQGIATMRRTRPGGAHPRIIQSCLVLEYIDSDDYNGESGPRILFASNSFSRIVNIDTSDVQGASFLTLVASQDMVKAADFLARVGRTENIIIEQLKFLVCSNEPALDGHLEQRGVTVDIMAAGSNEGAILLCRYDLSQRVARRSGNTVFDNDEAGYVSLEDIISSDPETSNLSDMWHLY
ncbi:hypothetical protein GGI07_005705 [Coemansia sp. Benny D115]|nr:hypothetical protein GGI07_005705 [Coemansia sp. Benny D115]